MKTMAAAFALVLPFAAATAVSAASLVDTYVAARDRYVKKFADSDIVGDEVARAEHQRARADLEQQLRRIIGPSEIKGFAKEGELNLDSLSSGFMGFGLLDALAYVSPDEKSRVLVTTDELFGKWLRARKPDVPQNADAAARSAAFYTRALPTDAMIFKYAELPVMKPADAKLAAVLLIARSQDIGPATPGEIVVSVVRGDRVFVAVAPAQAKVSAIAACDQVWKDLEKAAERLLAQYDQTEPKNEKLYDKYTKAQENNDRAYRACFAAHAKGESFFPALVRQAQALVDALPKR